MVATIGEAHDLGWRLTIYCRWGKRDGMKTIRECTARVDADLTTMLWTHGRDYPLARLDGRLKCPRCGSRRVQRFRRRLMRGRRGHGLKTTLGFCGLYFPHLSIPMHLALLWRFCVWRLPEPDAAVGASVRLGRRESGRNRSADRWQRRLRRAVVGLEPSCIFTLRDELQSMLPGESSATVARNALLFEEFLAREAEAGHLDLPLRSVGRRTYLHGHCHQKAFGAMNAVEKVLRLVPDPGTGRPSMHVARFLQSALTARP